MLVPEGTLIWSKRGALSADRTRHVMLDGGVGRARSLVRTVPPCLSAEIIQYQDERQAYNVPCCA
jgi:hypothetical protein